MSSAFASSPSGISANGIFCFCTFGFTGFLRSRTLHGLSLFIFVVSCKNSDSRSYYAVGLSFFSLLMHMRMKLFTYGSWILSREFGSLLPMTFL